MTSAAADMYSQSLLLPMITPDNHCLAVLPSYSLVRSRADSQLGACQAGLPVMSAPGYFRHNVLAMATPIPINQCEVHDRRKFVEATGGNFCRRQTRRVLFPVTGAQGCAAARRRMRSRSGYLSGGGANGGNVCGVSIDTRSIERGAIFVALRGEASDSP